MDEFLGFVVWLFVELLLICTGRVVVSLATVGRWRSERLSGEEGKVHAMAGALSFKRDGHRVVTRTGLLLIGLVFYVALVVGLIALN